MEVTKELSEAAVEILEIFRYCSDDVISKIPQKFIDYLRDIQSFDYVFEYDKTKRIEEQKLLPQTYYLIGLIYKDYICDDIERAEYIKELKDYKKNREAIKSEKYPIDDLFKNTNKELTENTEEKSLVKVEQESWVKRLFNKIKRAIKGNR